MQQSPFGQYVARRRRDAGLTQRELASRLHVTESAVSKWERGQSYPDITLLVPLSAALGVEVGELVSASHDHQARRIAVEARSYRRWRTGILWGTTLAYAAATAACFIVNLSVAHTLSWFWVVLTAIAIGYSLTTLPVLLTRRRGWITLAAAGGSLVSLLVAVRLLYGGDFLTVTLAALAFALLVVFLPFALRDTRLPDPWAQHRTVLVLAVDTVALLGLLAVILARADEMDAFLSLALPLTLVFAGSAAWVPALIIRYLPVARLFRAAIVTTWAAVLTITAAPVANAIIDRERPELPPVDLGTWTAHFVPGNVSLVTALGLLAVALVLGSTAAVRQSARPGALGD